MRAKIDRRREDGQDAEGTDEAQRPEATAGDHAPPSNPCRALIFSFPLSPFSFFRCDGSDDG